MSDTMLMGVLRMPFEIAMSTLTARIQYHQRGVQAADEIEKLTRERDEARAEVERLLETLRRIYDMSRPHTWRHVPREFMNETVLEIWQIVKQALEAKP